MPGQIIQPAGGPRRTANKGFIRSTYAALTSSENASVIRSIAVFGVRHFDLSSFSYYFDNVLSFIMRKMSSN